MGGGHGGGTLRGHTINCADAWLAATARINRVPLVTHNASDYIGVDDPTIISEAASTP